MRTWIVLPDRILPGLSMETPGDSSETNCIRYARRPTGYHRRPTTRDMLKIPRRLPKELLETYRKPIGIFLELHCKVFRDSPKIVQRTSWTISRYPKKMHNVLPSCDSGTQLERPTGDILENPSDNIQRQSRECRLYPRGWILVSLELSLRGLQWVSGKSLLQVSVMSLVDLSSYSKQSLGGVFKQFSRVLRVIFSSSLSFVFSKSLVSLVGLPAVFGESLCSFQVVFVRSLRLFRVVLIALAMVAVLVLHHT